MYMCAYTIGIIFELVPFDLYAAFFQNKRACIFISIVCKKKLNSERNLRQVQILLCLTIYSVIFCFIEIYNLNLLTHLVYM